MGPGTIKYRVTLDIEVSNACIKRVDNGIEHPEEFVRTELGWAYESFDGAQIKHFEDISNGAEPTVEEMVENLLESGKKTAVDIKIYGYGRCYITDATETGQFEEIDFRDEGHTTFQDSFKSALKKVCGKLCWRENNVSGKQKNRRNR